MLLPLFIDKVPKEIIQGYVEGNIRSFVDWMSKGRVSEDYYTYTVSLDKLYAEILNDSIEKALFDEYDQIAIDEDDLISKFNAISEVMKDNCDSDKRYLKDVGFIEEVKPIEELKDLSPVYLIQPHWGYGILFRVVDVDLPVNIDSIHREVRIVGDNVYIVECLDKELLE